MVGLLGSPVFAQKAVFKVQTERRVSQLESSSKETLRHRCGGGEEPVPHARVPWDEAGKPSPFLRAKGERMFLSGHMFPRGPCVCGDPSHGEAL